MSEISDLGEKINTQLTTEKVKERVNGNNKTDVFLRYYQGNERGCWKK